MVTKRGKPAARKLTERDLNILRRIGEGGLLTFSQVKRLFWPQAKEQTALDRLTQLFKAGHILEHYIKLGKRDDQPIKTVYTLTKQGAANFEKIVAERLATKLPAAHELKQQIIAAEARIKLEEQLAERGAVLVRWRTEHDLRGEAIRQKMKNNKSRRFGFGRLADIPDAAAVIQEADGTTHQLDIEIDGAYYGKMLKNKVGKFGKGGRPTLWVSVGQARAERVQNEVQQAGAENITVLGL